MSAGKFLAVFALLSAAACDAAEQMVAPPAEPSANTTGCTGPTVVSPKDGFLVTGSNAILTFQMDATCRRVNTVEAYDAATGTLVFSDATPEFETYQMGTGVGANFEYRYLNFGGSALPRGKYYNWRVRTHQVALDGYTVVQVSPWSSLGNFGVAPSRPVLSGNTPGSFGTPSISWTSADGATQYEVWRYLSHWGGSWDIASAQAGTTFSDEYFCVTNTNTGHWVTYYIEAVNTASGLRSTSTTSKTYYLCGVPPE